MPESSSMVFLPTISEIDSADHAFGRATSELEHFASSVEKFGGDDVPLDEALFMERAGIAHDNRLRNVDTATLARLLVFADEMLDDAETVRVDAGRLRGATLAAYRNYVIKAIDRRGQFEQGGDVA